MATPHMFTGINKKDPSQPSKPINVHALIGKLVLIVIFLIILGYALVNLFGFVTRVVQNWQELQFAYNKPAIVKAVRTQYESKALSVDEQFSSNKPSQEALMLKQIKQALATPSK